MTGPWWWIAGLIVGIILLVVGILLFSYGALYVKALLANAHVGLLEIIGMRLRGVQPSVIVDSRIMAIKAGQPVRTDELETHYLAGATCPTSCAR